MSERLERPLQLLVERLREWGGGLPDGILLMREAADAIESADKRSEYWKAEHLAANSEIDRLRAVIEEVNSWAICAPIATVDDMAENLPRIIEITSPNARVQRRAEGTSDCNA